MHLHKLVIHQPTVNNSPHGDHPVNSLQYFSHTFTPQTVFETSERLCCTHLGFGLNFRV